MDTKTPPIPLRHHERKEVHHRKQERSPEPVSLPPLTPVPSNCHQQQHRSKHSGNSAPWTKGPNICRTSDHHRRRPYRVLHIGATPLMHACQQADRSRVLRLLKEQEDTVGYRDRTLRSALHYCMDAGTGGAVASAAPELVNAPDAEGHTPLHLAVIAGDTQLVAVLLANGADVNAKDLEGHSVLHWATVCGEAECVRLVLAAGGRPSTPDLRGGSPLHYAAQCCGAAVTAELSVPKKIGLKVLQTLLEFGADVNAKDEDGRQPILWAASAGSVEAVLALARAGGTATAGATDKDGLTALHCAASRGHARCVEALVNLCGSNPDHVDDNGCSALHYAATLGHADATALLLRLGADPNRQDRKGRTPALCAAAKGQLETLKILAQHGGSLHARTIRGTGVAHEAVLSGRIELIEWLAKKRPSTLDVATHDGKTPLHVAALHGYLDVCKVLLDNGARINAVLRTSKSGPMTALDAALYRGHRDCAKLVQMHGGTTAKQLRTNQTAPNRVFAAKLRVKRNDSSDDEETSDSVKGRGHDDSDLYFEERWIEKRTRRRGAAPGSPRKSKDRRGSRSFSEEEVRLGKKSRRRERSRRARSESARYEGCPSAERSERKTIGKRPGRHEYGESTSESSEDCGEGVEDDDRRRFRSRKDVKTERGNKESSDVKVGSSENVEDSEGSEENDRSLSDDSLEVVVVKKSMEKTSEKFQITGRKSKTPRETSRETRVTETRRRSTRKKSKPERSGSKSEGIEAKDEEKSRARKQGRKTAGSDPLTENKSENQGSDGKEKDRVEDKRKEREKQFRKDATDSTSQETVERVTVTALVHKDQAPDTPKCPAKLRRASEGTAPPRKASKDAGEVVERVESTGKGSAVVKSEMDEMLEKADQLQNALLTKAADLRKDVDDIRRQMTNGSSQDDGRTPRSTGGRRASRGSGEEAQGGSDEPVTSTDGRGGEIVSESASHDSQQESPRSQNSEEKEVSQKSTGREEAMERTNEEAKDVKSGRRKGSKSSQGEMDDGRTSGKEDPSASGNDKSTDEGTSTSANLSRRPSTARPKVAQTSAESNSPRTEKQKSGENPEEQSQKDVGEQERSDKSSRRESMEDNSWGSRSSREKSFKTLPDEDEGNEATSTEEAVQSANEMPLEEEAKDVIEQSKEPASSEEPTKLDDDPAEMEGKEEKDVDPGKSRNSSGSGKSNRVQTRSRPSTGRSGRAERTGSSSKSPSKRSLFESSEERSPDRSAIVAVIESPEWDEADDREIEKEIRDAIGEDGEEAETEPDNDDGLGVMRVLPSTSEEETPRMGDKLLRGPKTESFTRVDRKLRVKSSTSPQGHREGRSVHSKQRKDSGGRDSGIEPSPRVSKIPKRTFKCCPNTDKQQALNMETVTRDVQISLRRYHLERKIFFQLMELKRLQIRHGRANEHVLIKRQVETFHKAGMTGPTLGVVKYDLPLTFRHFEAFLYEQLRRLQRRPATPDFCTEAKQCTQKTHRCHHATSAYTSIPVYTYLGGGGLDRDEGLLPRIESRGRGQMTVEVTRGEEKQVIALPTENLDRTKRYFVTFTVRGDNQETESKTDKKPMVNNSIQRNTKSV